MKKQILVLALIITSLSCSIDAGADKKTTEPISEPSFFETYNQYYAGVEAYDDEGNEYGIFTGTVYEFTQTTYYKPEKTYRFVLFICNDFDAVNGWCNSIGEECCSFVVTIE